MLRSLLMMMTVLTVLSFPVSAEEEKKNTGKLEGTWVATLWKRGPGEVGKDKVATELVITKDAYEFPKGINRISAKGKLKVDAQKNEIEFTPTDGPAKGRTLLGIYKVEGDKLTICFTGVGGKRPTELKSTDRNTVLATYERKK